MAHQQTAPTLSLLDLPDTALLRVLRCLAADRDLSSLFSAARAHSTLHQLSAAALDSIDVAVKNQQQVDGLQQYLSRHTAHVQSLELRGGNASTNWLLLDELPPGLQLHRLRLGMFLRLQLLPSGDRAGALQAGAPLKHLEIRNCRVVDTLSETALELALSQLPQLESLKFVDWSGALPFPGRVLSHLQQLTSLDVMLADGNVLEHIDLVPGLLNLRAGVLGHISSSKLSALQQLTSLVLGAQGAFPGDDLIDTAGFANKGRLQHLAMELALAGKSAGVSALLSHLQHMTQLTHLSLQRNSTLPAPNARAPAAYAALTASSTLQHLDVSSSSMPEGVWLHMLPADRQLLQLRVLKASECGSTGHWTHADTARLASCCPNLQELSMRTREPLAAQVLQPLRSLTALTALAAGELDDAGLAAAAELTQLRQLTVWQQASTTDAGLLQLTQLRQLMELDVFRQEYRRFKDKVRQHCCCCSHCLRLRVTGTASCRLAQHNRLTALQQ
jgi:hypothetical protein